jgi:hypothetical protein
MARPELRPRIVAVMRTSARARARARARGGPNRRSRVARRCAQSPLASFPPKVTNGLSRAVYAVAEANIHPRTM